MVYDGGLPAGPFRLRVPPHDKRPSGCTQWVSDSSLPEAGTLPVLPVSLFAVAVSALDKETYSRHHALP